MKFFDKKIMTDEHIIALRESRKIKVKNKIINYNNNFIELINMESGLRVFPENDELLDMINSIERFDPDWNCFINQDWGEYRNYKYEELPAKLRRYMHDMDALFFARWVKSVNRSAPVSYYEQKEERLFTMIPGFTEEEYAKYVVLGHPIPSTLGKKAKDSARRSYKTVSALFKANAELFKQFVTFTFAREENAQKYLDLNAKRQPDEVDLQFEYVDATDFEIAKDMFSKTMNTLSRNLKRKGIPFEYIAVWETQSNGNYHFHLLCTEIPQEFLYSVPMWLDYDYRNKKFNHGKGLKYWKYGKSDVQTIKSNEKISTYVSKYIIKSFINVNAESYQEYLNKRKFFPSKGLARSKEEYITDEQFEKVLREMEVAEKVAYTKEYTNPYTQSTISKKIYTMI